MDALDGWDAQLEARLANVRLIGELNLNEAEFNRLASDIEIFVTRQRHSADDRLSELHPVSMAVFLVFCGVYAYDAGNFWTPVHRRIGVRGLGPAFERFLEERRLERFPDLLEEGALRYVAPILAHGGVPSSCLPDYFELLAHALRRVDWQTLSARELIREWHARGFSHVQIDRPIQRFLVHGGAVAQDFLQRTIDLLEEGLETGSLPESTMTGLPSRIVDTCARWLSARQQPDGGGGLARHRYIVPRIWLDPWAGDGPVVRLPEQQLRDVANSARWVIGATGASQATSTVAAPFQHGGTATAEQEYPLGSPAARWDISFLVDGNEQATWQFAGVTPARPLLAFSPTTQELLRWSDELPAGEVWLVYPSEHTLSVVSGARQAPVEVRERFISPPGSWQHYTIAAVELPAGQQLVVAGGPHEALRFQIQRRETASRRASTNFDTLLVRGVWAGPNRVPVLFHAPTFAIPVGSDDAESIERWSIALIPEPRSRPAGRVIRRVTELAYSSHPDGSVTVDLEQKALLDTRSFGTFTVVVRGPLGQDARATFALVPGLHVGGHQSHETIDRELDEPAMVVVHAAVPFTGRATSDAMIVDRSPNQMRVAARGSMLVLGLDPADASDSPAPRAAVDLRIPVAGVRWALTGLHETTTRRWSSRPFVVSQDALVDAPAAGILLDGLALTDQPGARGIRARLATSDRRVLHEQQLTTRGERVWIPLAPFSTTIEAHAEALLSLAVDVRGPTGMTLVADREVLRITRELVVIGLAINSTRDGELRYLRVHWHQPHRVNDRALRLWSRARPWEPPRVFLIPNHQEGTHEVALPAAQLPAGPYRADIVVDDPWLPEPASLTGLSSHAVDVEIGDPEERAWQRARPATTLERLERFLLTQDAEVLDDIATRLDASDLEAAISVVTTLSAGSASAASEGVRIALRVLREAIVAHQACIPALWPRLAAELVAGREAALATLVALGLPQLRAPAVKRGLRAVEPSTIASLERAFPWLFLFRHAPALLAGGGDRESADVLLGSEPLAVLLPTADPADTWDLTPRHDAILHAFSHIIDSRALRLPHGQLALIHEQVFSAIPSGALDLTVLPAAITDILLRLRDPLAGTWRAEVEAWVGSLAPRIEMALDAIEQELEGSTSRSMSGPRVAIALLRQSLRCSGGEPAEGIALVPFVAGGVALLQRLLARRPALAPRGRIPDELLLAYARHCLDHARAIYEFDLCLMDLLVTVPAAPAPDGEDADEPDAFDEDEREDR